MLFSRRGFTVYIYRKAIDMCCGFHKLTGFVREAYKMENLLEGHVFVFFGKNPDGQSKCTGYGHFKIHHLLAKVERQ